MRTIMIISIALIVYSLNAFAENLSYAIPVKDEVPVYRNEARKVFEQPLFFIGKDDRCVVKASEKALIKITAPSGKTGWVELAAVKLVSRNTTFSYNETDVPGYIDDPEPILINDGREAMERSLSLNRSFADELRVNVDRETIARQSGE